MYLFLETMHVLFWTWCITHHSQYMFFHKDAYWHTFSLVNWTKLTSNQARADGKGAGCCLGLNLWLWGVYGLCPRSHHTPNTYPLSPVPAGPQCALPFSASAVANGAVLCETISGQAPGIQQCQLVCRQGFHSAAPSSSSQCDARQRRWVSAAPLLQACQSMSALIWSHLISSDLICWGLRRARSSVHSAKPSFYHRTTVWITALVIGELLSWDAEDVFCLLPSSPVALGWPLCQKLSLFPVIIEL